VTTLQDKVPAGLDRKEAEVYRHLDPKRLPQHIAIIMDGNGRWAKRRHMPRVAGHRAGVAAVRSTVERTAVTPARCPATRGMCRRLAQRPLPSMMIAICFGSLAESSRR
jgi:hypothetical protein